MHTSTGQKCLWVTVLIWGKILKSKYTILRAQGENMFVYLKHTLSTVILQGLVSCRIFSWFFPLKSLLFFRVGAEFWAAQEQRSTWARQYRRAGPRTAAHSLVRCGIWSPVVTVCFQCLWNLLISGSHAKKKGVGAYNIYRHVLVDECLTHNQGGYQFCLYAPFCLFFTECLKQLIMWVWFF